MVLAMHCFGQQLVGANYELSQVARGKLQEIDIEQVLTLLSPPPLSLSLSHCVSQHRLRHLVVRFTYSSRSSGL